MTEEMVRTGVVVPAAVQGLPGLSWVAGAAERIAHQVLGLVVAVLVAKSGLPTSQHRMHPRFILKTMFKSLSIT
jgi:hypothetical protein